jgi:heparosan-N-sulfate-glucuronate 5-epimerase
MGSLQTVRSTWGTVASRGDGYESQSASPRARLDGVHGYFVDLRAKVEARGAAEPALLQPAALAQLALGYWERSLTGEAGAATVFERLCGLLAERGEAAADGLRWPYSVPVAKYRLQLPWYSAMAQGQVASVFVRAQLATGETRWRTLAREAVRPLLATEDSDLVTVAPEGPILEEAPSEPRSHVLNGWIYALWGLRDVHVGLGEQAAGDRFAASARCLAALLERYDVGWWTRYSLYPHRVADLAKPFYHRLHATQAGIMHRLTGLDEFARAAERWRGYDEPLRRGLALLQKSLFVLAVRAVDR